MCTGAWSKSCWHSSALPFLRRAAFSQAGDSQKRVSASDGIIDPGVTPRAAMRTRIHRWSSVVRFRPREPRVPRRAAPSGQSAACNWRVGPHEAAGTTLRSRFFRQRRFIPAMMPVMPGIRRHQQQHHGESAVGNRIGGHQAPHTPALIPDAIQPDHIDDGRVARSVQGRISRCRRAPPFADHIKQQPWLPNNPNNRPQK